MNTKQKNKSGQTEQDKQSTKQLGLYNASGDRQISLKKLTATGDVVQAAVLENKNGQQEWYPIFLGQPMMKREEARESMEELQNLTSSQILEICGRMILAYGSLINKQKTEKEWIESKRNGD